MMTEKVCQHGWPESGTVCPKCDQEGQILPEAPQQRGPHPTMFSDSRSQKMKFAGEKCALCGQVVELGTLVTILPSAQFSHVSCAELVRSKPWDDGRIAPPTADELYERLQHGDAEHRAWLREAIDAAYSGKPNPVPRKAAEQARFKWNDEELRRQMERTNETENRLIEWKRKAKKILNSFRRHPCPKGATGYPCTNEAVYGPNGYDRCTCGVKAHNDKIDEALAAMDSPNG